MENLTTHDWLVLQRYKVALEKIAKLEEAKEMKNSLISGCPTHLMKEDGFEPINPMVKEGLRIAAKIAKDVLIANVELTGAEPALSAERPR